MDFIIKNGAPEKQRSACSVVGVYEARKLSPQAAALDAVSKGYLSDILRRGDMEGKLGSALVLHNVPNTGSERILLVGLGKEREFQEKQYRTAFHAAIKRLTDTGATDAIIYLTELSVGERNVSWRVEQAVLIGTAAVYRFDQLKSKAEPARQTLRKVALNVTARNEVTPAEKALASSLAIAEGINLTKDLGNLPGNICTPTYLAEQAVKLGKTHKLKVQVLEQAQLEKLGMGSFLAVSRGSRQPPKLIVMQHLGGDKKSKPVVLVGKGITFDTGGISIKPAGEMDEMKFDMCGAASVLGTMKAIAKMGLKLNVIGIIPTCENMPDGNATRPGDVVTSLSGQTIEILNTDAEGRLILCDALTYAERFEPAAVVDIATLTGACVIALGHVVSGLLANQDSLAKELLQAGEEAYDRAWQMPLYDDYQEQLKSNFADVANIGGRAGGTITAACFLSRFTKAYKWAHLDIAGTAWKSGGEKGATGRPVGLLTHFLINRAK
ncbi:MAG: leucyl aminopeptidase [Pseudomonadota bacterium]